MVNEPENGCPRRCARYEYSPFLLDAGPLPAVSRRHLSDIRVSFPGMPIRMPSLRTDQREAGPRHGAEMVFVFPFMEGFGFGFGLVLAADLCAAASPTNGRRTLPNTNPLGMVSCRHICRCTGRPTEGGQWCGSSRQTPASGQQRQLGLLHA